MCRHSLKASRTNRVPNMSHNYMKVSETDFAPKTSRRTCLLLASVAGVGLALWSSRARVRFGQVVHMNELGFIAAPRLRAAREIGELALETSHQHTAVFRLARGYIANTRCHRLALTLALGHVLLPLRLFFVWLLRHVDGPQGTQQKNMARKEVHLKTQCTKSQPAHCQSR